MRFGAHVSAAGGVDSLLARAGELEVEALQFFLSSPRTWRFRPIAPTSGGSTMEVAHALGIDRMVVHAPYLINLGSDDAELVRKSGELLGAIVMAAVHDGLSAVILHPGSPKRRGSAASLDQWSRAIEPIARLATPSTQLLLENTAGGGGSMGRTLEELVTLADRCGGEPGSVGVCIDTQHLFAAGYDLRDARERDEVASQLLGSFGEVRVVHLNDSATELGSAHDRHANLDEGAIGLDALMNFVDHEVFRSADIILEVPGLGEGPRKEDVALLRNGLASHGLVGPLP